MTVDATVGTTVDEPAGAGTGPIAVAPLVGVDLNPVCLDHLAGFDHLAGLDPSVDLKQPADPDRPRLPRTRTRARAGRLRSGADARALRSPAVAVTLLAFLSFVGSLVLQAKLFPDGSGDADEAAYVLQARMLLQGRLTLDASAVEPFFRPWLTGEHGGKVFTKYLPGWPAMLACSQAVFGTMTVAPAAVAAGWVAGTYRLARELFRDARTALLAALGVALSPLVLLHTALPLAYAACVAVLTLASAELLRGARTGSRAALVAGGAGAGYALLIRPFDAVIVVLPVLAVVLARGRAQGRERGRAVRRAVPRTVPRRAAWALLGALPLVVILLAYCWYVTGSPLRMPLSASDPLDRFGFGPRRILPSEPTFLFTRRLAFDALRETLAVAPSWFFGGVGLVTLAAVGLLVPRHRPERLMLLATSGMVLAAYTFWWGSAFAMPGLRDGLGPHYHLAAFTPVVILAADGARWLWALSARVPGRLTRRMVRPGLAVVVGVGLVAMTLPTLPARIDMQRAINEGNAFLDAVIPRQLDGPAVILVTPPTSSRYTQIPYHTLRNTPGLDGPVVYAADVGPGSAALPDRVPGRTIYRLRPGEIVDPAVAGSLRGSFKELRQVTGTRISIQVDVESPAATGSLYVRLGSTVLSAGATTSRPFVLTSGPATGPDEIGMVGGSRPAELVVGFTEGRGAEAAVWEERIPLVRRPGGDLSLLAPGLGWRRLPASGGGRWYAADTSPVLRVSVTGSVPSGAAR
ncbi:hypothetical protein UG55_102023 [Frankia sp. EI5c]|uniref:DUF7846 domain-containing protein n=1 Tax=Frankia sp. EI5c TaxID=683316 RepID=UPI0007C3ABB6|nr:glycosyltransferase family 39 protein [Frankia sp. EI5c]OAA25755.1 hypothetical protein UG55_102023 [Frankia sp. EI5c]